MLKQTQQIETQDQYLVAQQVAPDCVSVYRGPDHFDGGAVNYPDTHIHGSFQGN